MSHKGDFGYFCCKSQNQSQIFERQRFSFVNVPPELFWNIQLNIAKVIVHNINAKYGVRKLNVYVQNSFLADGKQPPRTIVRPNNFNNIQTILMLFIDSYYRV